MSDSILDVDTWHALFRGRRLLVDGVDRTNDCFLADPPDGWADCYAKDESGKRVIEGTEAKKVRLYGRIEIR